MGGRGRDGRKGEGLVGWKEARVSTGCGRVAEETGRKNGGGAEMTEVERGGIPAGKGRGKVRLEDEGWMRGKNRCGRARKGRGGELRRTEGSDERLGEGGEELEGGKEGASKSFPSQTEEGDAGTRETRRV